MNKLAFWAEWDTSSRFAFKILLLLLLFFISAFLIVEWGDLSPFYYWKITGYLENLPYPIFSDHSALLESKVYTDLPLIFQKVFGASTSLSHTYTYVYLLLLYLGLIGCLTMATYLQRFWYVLSMGLWILLMALSGIGKIGFFGWHEETPVIVAALLFLPASYYFNAIHEHISVGRRYLVFLGLLMVMLGLVYFGSDYETPLLYLARFSFLPAALISTIFILIVGHEVVYAILTLTTPYTKNASNNTSHFIILTTVYLLNLLVLYLYRIGYLDWNIYYLNEFAVLALSAVFGLWGIKSRAHRYESILPFYPTTAFLYLCLALITFLTLFYQSFQANDPFVDAMQNLTLYSHIGFGSMFFLYIIGNFINQLRQNLPVHQFAYHDENFPYISARLAGLIVVAALFFRAHYSSFYLSVAGYYNGLGDLNMSLEQKDVAQFYYTKSTAFSQYNHHANFQLAQLEKKDAKRLQYAKSASKKKATPFAYACLGKAYENNSRFFDALFCYQQGLKDFPNHWALQNNLALLYNKTQVVDSAIYYLERSKPGSWKKNLIAANLSAVYANHGLSIGQIGGGENADRFDVQCNTLAYRVLSGDTTQLSFVSEPPSVELNLFTFGYLKNLGIYCYEKQLPYYLNLIDPYLEQVENISFRDELLLVKAINLYQMGRVSAAFETMYRLMEVDEDASGRLHTLMGKWCMELGAPLQASKYFEEARQSGYPLAIADLAQSYSLSNNQSVAGFLLNRLLTQVDSTDTGTIRPWTTLAEAVENQQVAWKPYVFTREEALFAAAKDDKPNQKLLFEQLGRDNPFFEKGVIAAATFFRESAKDKETAYRLLHGAININTYSAALINAYIDHCLATGLIDIAESAVIKLVDILPSEEFAAYEAVFEEKKSEAQTTLDKNW